MFRDESGGSDYFGALLNSERLKDFRNRVFFTLCALFLYRFGSYVPIPALHPQIVENAMSDLVGEGGAGAFLGVLNVFSGGAFSRLAIFSLGIMPYITASIIVQLSSNIFSFVGDLKKDGDAGRRKISSYTRYAALIFCIFQSTFFALNLNAMHTANSLPVYISPIFMSFFVVVTLCAGSIFLLWLGENITARGIGNGISLIIFSSIISELPGSIMSTFSVISVGFDSTIIFLLFVIVMVVLVMMLVVYVERSSRNLSAQYLHRGFNSASSSLSKIPLKINMSGVLSPIFANAFLASITFLIAIVVRRVEFFEPLMVYFNVGSVLYIFFYFLLIVFFCFFYTSVIFDADSLADNLKKTGCILPGKRPGATTAAYLRYVVNRITVIGAAYIAFVCLSADILRMRYSIPFTLGGTSLLIVVGVIMDLVYNIKMHFVSHKYDNLSKRVGIKARVRKR